MISEEIKALQLLIDYYSRLKRWRQEERGSDRNCLPHLDRALFTLRASWETTSMYNVKAAVGMCCCG